MKAAGMKIIAYDPFLPPDRGKQLGVEMVDLDDLLARSDFITIHTPLTEKTRGLISAERLKKTKKGARIINCARGGIVDEAALAEAVKSGHLAGAGIDVFSQEPMTAGPLFGVPGIVLTPHLGASTEEAEERCCQQIAEQVVAYFKQGEIINAVNVDVATDKSLAPFVQTAIALGRLAVALLGAAPQRVEVHCAGEIEKKDTGAITAGAVQGILEACGAEGANIVNAALLARQRGIEIVQVSGRAAETFRSVVSLRLSGGGRSIEVDGTAYDNKSPRIVRIDEFEIDLRPEGTVLILQYPDRPGYVGKFGTILGKHEINIGSMEVGRTKKRGRALMAIAVDETPSANVIQALARVEDVAQVQMVDFASR
ncbi:MAG: ACT domain-containing protein, partial [Planctomycetota bacterium]|nr:ACT domain-containing protein [Planctomycetota bacterium]